MGCEFGVAGIIFPNKERAWQRTELRSKKDELRK
jgi:hypothetical protein